MNPRLIVALVTATKIGALKATCFDLLIADTSMPKAIAHQAQTRL